jgi:hypothetical protein
MQRKPKLPPSRRDSKALRSLPEVHRLRAEGRILESNRQTLLDPGVSQQSEAARGVGAAPEQLPASTNHSAGSSSVWPSLVDIDVVVPRLNPSPLYRVIRGLHHARQVR